MREDRESLAYLIKKVPEVGKGILHGLQKMDNVQHLDPVLYKVPSSLFEKALPSHEFVPDTMAQYNLSSEPVSLTKFIIIVVPLVMTVLYLGQLDGGVAVQEGQHHLCQLRTPPELVLCFMRHDL